MPDQPIATTNYSWSDPTSRETLQLIAEGVTQLAGFEVVTIGVVRPDDTLEVITVVGSEEARTELQDVRIPLADLLSDLAHADDWGRLMFVPAERVRPEVSTWGWTPPMQRLDAEDAWDPDDYLAAPLRDGNGTLVGIMSIDVPTTGRRPDRAQQEILNLYAEQAERAVILVLEREQLAERVRMAQATRRVVREASAQLSIEQVIQEAKAGLLEGFRADGMWLYVSDPSGRGASQVLSRAEVDGALPPEVTEMAERVARAAWADQRVLVVDPRRPPQPPFAPADHEIATFFLRASEVSSALFVPLGAGRECVGHLSLSRAIGAPEWSEWEAAAALDLGHDLGRAVLNARTFEREHQLVQELRAVDAYKGRMISTVAHELKNPLASVYANLELLGMQPELSEESRGWVAAVDRGAQRMAKVVDDLLLLARVGEAGPALVPRPVDLREVVADVVDVMGVAATQKGIALEVDVPEQPVTALGDPDEIDRVCLNLLSNAVKYTRDGGRVSIHLEQTGTEAVLTCSDEGIGISADDQHRIGTEFFRSTNPEAVAQSGTGLGLAIVRRIVDRHQGRLEIESALGHGSTFRVRLPAA